MGNGDEGLRLIVLRINIYIYIYILYFLLSINFFVHFRRGFYFLDVINLVWSSINFM